MGWTTKQSRLDSTHGQRHVFSSHQTHCLWAHPTSPSKIRAAVTLRIKQSGRGSFYSPQSLAGVRNPWSSTSIPPYAFVACTLATLHFSCNRLGFSVSKDNKYILNHTLWNASWSAENNFSPCIDREGSSQCIEQLNNYSLYSAFCLHFLSIFALNYSSLKKGWDNLNVI